MPPTADSCAPLPRLLVVTVDRLPAWMLSAWGATWVAMPALDALAAGGLSFDRVITPSLDPRETSRELLGESGGMSLLSIAASQGRRVAIVADQPAIVEAVPAGASVDRTIIEAVCPRHIAADEASTNLGRLFAAAVDVAAERRHDLIWCHAGSLGIAWDAPDELRQMYLDPDDPPPPPGAAIPNHGIDAGADPDLPVALRHVFAAQLTLLDRCIGRLIATMGTGSIILVAGLRGMPLGLHGWMGGAGEEADDRPPFSESTHVPAILVDAEGRMAGQRFGGLVVPADLGATLRELTGAGGVPPSEPWEGRSLVSLLREWRTDLRDRVVVRAPAGDAILTPSWQLIGARCEGGGHRQMLFAKPDDFFECNDVADRCAGVVDALAAVLGRGGADDSAEAWRSPLPATTGNAHSEA
ncbi:MAG: hypothetical protein ACKOEX_01770 [Planctomycetia bacterium]